MLKYAPRKKVEIHILKNYPYSNLNRDEFGTPKTCTFAGVPRGRISSQSLKRSWREYFRDCYTEDDISVRTRMLPALVKEHLENEGKDEKFISEVVTAIKKLFVSDKKAKEMDAGIGEQDAKLMTKQIIPLTPAEIEFFKEYFANCSIEDVKDFKPKDLKEKFADLGLPVDIALWGRMITSPAFNGSEASMQVAHAVSTNELYAEQDFFSAVDDRLKGEGAAIVDNAEYNCCCYYEYACLDFDHLIENLGGNEEKAKELLPAAIKAMCFSNPSGKNTTTATNILPSAVLVETKEVPYSLVNAFAVPCDSSGNGLVANSVNALTKQCDVMAEMYGIDAKRVFFTDQNTDCFSAETVKTFAELLEKVCDFI